MDQNLRVLIVEDDPAMAKSVQAILNDRGYDIQIMNSPREALAEINQAKFDLVLLDVMMPEMSGFELLEAFDRETVNTLFFIMTGDSSMESAVEAIRMGASDYLKKPFDPNELIIRVENLLNQIRLKQRNIHAEKEKRNLEIQLQQSQKMEAIGTLAGGIAHDFNNILGIIMGNTEMAIADIGTTNSPRKNLETIITAGNRAKEMISRLLSFSRIKDSELIPIRLNTIIIDSLKLLRASIPANIEIQHRISETPYTVLGDTTQIHQIMINLCTNAAHAMQESGGTLTVKLNNIVIDDNSLIEYSGLKKGEYVQLVVIDTGHGIDPEIKDHIFDPYFTTKEPDRGTGMGLSVIHNIVKNHGGDIRTFSEVGVKTEFQILLPIIDNDLPESESDAVTEIPKGQERILLVDDEEMIVDIMKLMLERLGYRVTGHTVSLTALEEFRTFPGDFDLVITDMTMPGMTGDRLAEAIKAIQKDIPIILCTGFNEKINPHKPENSSIQAILMKPVSMNDLAITIRKVIDQNQRERRKDKRYGLKQSTFVISKIKPCKRGKIIDISRSGLSLKDAKNGTRPEQF